MEAAAPGSPGKAKAAVVKGKGGLFKTRSSADQYKVTRAGSGTDTSQSALATSLLALTEN